MMAEQKRTIDRDLERMIAYHKHALANYAGSNNLGMLASTYANLVRALDKAGLREEAAKISLEAIPVINAKIEEDSAYSLAAGGYSDLGDVLRVAGKPEEAKAAKLKAAAMYRDEVLSGDERRLSASNAFTLGRAAQCFIDADMESEAIPLIERSAEIFLEEAAREEMREDHSPDVQRYGNMVLMYIDDAVKVLVDGGLESKAVPIAEDFIARFRERAQSHGGNRYFESAKEDLEQVIRVAKMVGLSYETRRAEADIRRLAVAKELYEKQQGKQRLLRRATEPIEKLWYSVSGRITSGTVEQPSLRSR